jgi:hypothetical protein
MTTAGQNRTLNKNLTQLNFLTNLTDCCVPSRVIHQRQLYGDEFKLKLVMCHDHGVLVFFLGQKQPDQFSDQAV